MTLRCIAIDDEPLALGLISSFIEQTPFLELVGKYGNAIDGLRTLHLDEDIDLLFLDIQMADLTGLELARLLEGKGLKKRPLIIFTTAFDQYAIEGYKVNAIDYLLKPFNYEEFLRAASKAKSLKEDQNAPTSSGSTHSSSEAIPEYIFIKVEYQLIKVLLRDIRYIEGLKDYVKVHLESEKHPLLSLSTLKTMEEKLPSERFLRIHRSYIVNLDKINSITRSSVQIGQETLTISDNYRQHFHETVKSGLH